LVTTGACAVHCRYCFRRHFPYHQESAASDQARSALARVAEDTSISELILSGGDPLSLANRRLQQLTRKIETIPHLRRIRLHTRLPVMVPERVDAGLLNWLDSLRLPVVLVLHVNHANEIDEHVATALAPLRSRPITLLNQAVLLRGVNDSVDALAALSERLLAVGVLPYYLHALDPVRGAAHFAVPDGTARDLGRALRARLPGYLVPTLVREIPGAMAKTPL
jgi:EF-P beta-lysylation protein EpmB